MVVWEEVFEVNIDVDSNSCDIAELGGSSFGGVLYPTTMMLLLWRRLWRAMRRLVECNGGERNFSGGAMTENFVAASTLVTFTQINLESFLPPSLPPLPPPQYMQPLRVPSSTDFWPTECVLTSTSLQA
ncbi:unnamed protein product [Calypogeia fissa]